jgi:hypothetical protein
LVVVTVEVSSITEMSDQELGMADRPANRAQQRQQQQGHSMRKGEEDNNHEGWCVYLSIFNATGLATSPMHHYL